MRFNKLELRIVTLSLALALTACGSDDAKKSGDANALVKQSSAGIHYDMSKPAAFTSAENCKVPDFIINSYPYPYILEGGKACEISIASESPPNWIFQSGEICLQNEIISKQKGNLTSTLKHNAGVRYTMSHSDGSPDVALTLCDPDYSKAPLIWGVLSEPNDKANYDFEQSYYKYCKDNACSGFPKHYQKYSDYSASVLSDLNLSTSLQNRWIKSHLQDNYAGLVTQSSFNNRNHATDHLLTFHLMPNGNPALHEYVVYVRLEGDGGFDNVKDWGGRIKCAPAKTSSGFQNTSCP